MDTASVLPQYPLRDHVRRVIEAKAFNGAILAIIFLNTGLIAMQTHQVSRTHFHALRSRKGPPVATVTTACVTFLRQNGRGRRSVQTGTSVPLIIYSWACIFSS